MKIGFRVPSLKKRIAARTSPARFIRHSLGFKAPHGWGWLTNPKKAAYNRVYNRTTFGCLLPILTALALVALLASLAMAGAPASGPSAIYGPTGTYAGRVQPQAGQPGTSSVYGPTGQYQGRVVTQPDGSQQAYGPTGQYLGRSQAQPQAGGQGGQQ